MADARRDQRVRAVHAQARPTVALAVLFAAAAPVAAAVPHRTGTWLPLHLLLAGAVVLAISATTQLFTVTWSAAPAPPDRPVALQRALLAGGVLVLAVARELRWPAAAVAAAGAAVAASLLLLAFLLRTTVRAGTVRRFDQPVRHYLTALGFGTVGAALGGAMAVTGDAELRAAHLTANVLGLIGIVALGTLPSFVATTARMKTSPAFAGPWPGRALGLVAAATAVAVTGFAAGADLVAAAGLAGWIVALVVHAALLPRPGRKQVGWAGPRLLAVGCSLVWTAGAVAVAAWQAAAGREPFTVAVVAALAVGGLVQLLWGALCYLVPVLAGGGHERLAASFAATRSWPGLAAANVVPLLLVLGLGGAGVAAGAAWAADAVWRFGRVATAR